MDISYDLFIEAFLDKITDYGFLAPPASVTEAMVERYLRRTCSEFNHICLYDLNMSDRENRALTDNFDENDVEEIVDIVSQGMVVQWMKPYVNRAEGYENVLNTNDFRAFSPAEILKQVNAAYVECKAEFKNFMFTYSYKHGDLSQWNLQGGA